MMKTTSRPSCHSCTRPLVLLVAAGVISALFAAPARAELRLGTFAVDATPPVGAPLAYDPMTGVSSELSCRGIVLIGSDAPIVLCAVDWIGIGGGGNRAFRERIAAAVETTPDRVAVHTLHQHDAPRCNFSAEMLLAQHGHGGIGFDPVHARGVIDRAAKAAAVAKANASLVTHVGYGQGEVKEVASNRRILGEDGKVLYTRWTATKDPKIRAQPVGTVDTQLKLIGFYHQDKALAALTYYATHPQSYYRTGLASVDFPGLARNSRQQATKTPHIHFNGAGGNVTAGKWNDGSQANRQVLADKVAAGMKAAWESMQRVPIEADKVRWQVAAVRLPVGKHLDEEKLMAQVTAKETAPATRYTAAKLVSWLRQSSAGAQVEIGCLSLGDVRILHLPGELFVEYQLAAQKMAPNRFVAVAAYGDYSPGYIGTEVAYGQGGYETSERATNVDASVEKVLLGAMQDLLKE